MIRRLLILVVAMATFAIAQAATQQSDSTSRRVKFAWGAEFGSSIDLSAHDMSSIDFNAGFGLKYRWISLLGVGAGANIMISNSCRTYPIFAILRTSFSERPKILFMDLRGGVALSYLPRNVSQTGAYCSAGVGFNLARGKNFQSYLVAGYTFVGRRDVTDETGFQPYESLDYAGIRLGITF